MYIIVNNPVSALQHRHRTANSQHTSRKNTVQQKKYKD